MLAENSESMRYRMLMDQRARDKDMARRQESGYQPQMGMMNHIPDQWDSFGEAFNVLGEQTGNRQRVRLPHEATTAPMNGLQSAFPLQPMPRPGDIPPRPPNSYDALAKLRYPGTGR